MSDTVVFIPAWNEEDNLPDVLDDLSRELPDVDVLVVDDGSTDRTAEIARGGGKALPVLAEPFRTEAPEVEALLRLSDAGLHVEEVPVRWSTGRAASRSSAAGRPSR